MYKRPNSEMMLAAPVATGGFKGIIAGKATKVDFSFFELFFFY